MTSLNTKVLSLICIDATAQPRALKRTARLIVLPRRPLLADQRRSQFDPKRTPQSGRALDRTQVFGLGPMMVAVQ
jgi:hypothetical protein